MTLSDEAKSEIAKAIGIVREDRFEKYARTVLKPADKEEKPQTDKPDEIEKPDENKLPPPEKEKEVKEEVTKRVDRWWGEIESD